MAIVGTIVAIAIPNDPFTLKGDREKGTAIAWLHWIHYNGSNGRHWRLGTELAPLTSSLLAQINPNYMTLLPKISITLSQRCTVT